MNILIAGDYCDKYRVKETISEEKYDTLFGKIKDTVRQYDLSILNFEFPVVVTNCKPIPKCGPNLIGQKKAIDAIRYAGFNVCTLANNHILDQGETCCLDTKRLIEESGIKTVGVGRNKKEAEEILFLEEHGETLAIINCCEHEFSIATDSTPGANPLSPIRQYYKIKEAREKADYVLVIVHGGHEHFQLPSPRMKDAYRFFIDSGADVVINHHQHCYSGYEEYNNGLIFYGLGNLLFDHLKHRNNIWNEGYMVGLEFAASKKTYKLLPYTQCSKGPTVSFMDTEQNKEFCNKIEVLNRIIVNDNSLRKKYDEYATKKCRDSISIFAPWQSRITRALFNRGYLPMMVNKRRLSIIKNYITCESHRDLVIKAIQNKWSETFHR